MADKPVLLGREDSTSAPPGMDGESVAGVFQLAGALRSNDPMARHVTWRAGGHAAVSYAPHDLDDLARFLSTLRPDESLMAVGLGSNLLVRDGGFSGTVVFTHGALNRLYLEPVSYTHLQ